MKNIYKNLLAGILLAGFASFASSQAQTLALTGGAGGVTTYSGSIGYTFSLSVSETLDSLGLSAGGQTETNQEVGIFNTSGTLLASAFVSLAPADAGTYVFSNAITDSGGFTGTLTAGTNYVIATQGTGYTAGSAPSTSAEVTIVNGNYSDANGFASPNNAAGIIYVGPNFKYGAVVPEPATWALMLSGLTVLAVGLRFRQRSL